MTDSFKTSGSSPTRQRVPTSAKFEQLAFTFLETENEVIQFMRDEGLPLTWENFLAIQFLGQPPEDLGPEAEGELVKIYDTALMQSMGIQSEIRED